MLGVAVWVVAGIGAVALLTRWLDRGSDHPDEWDGRVAELAAFVADARGLEWEHPVHVDFLTAAEYTAATTGSGDEPTLEEEDELQRYGHELRALGVASGELDLVAAFDQASDAGTLAFYDPVGGRIRVRGTEMTVGLRGTLVHELTHALQDQHFDLESINDPDLDTGEANALLGLIEGDAIRMERAYVDEELSEAEREAYDAEYAAGLEESEEATQDVPAFLDASFGAPYALGDPFVTMLERLGGNHRVDEAFADPPTTEEHLFDPGSFLDDEGSEEIDLGFDDDVELFDEDTFGITSWYLMLAERVDPRVALDAALGWSGDAFAAFERDGRTCVRVGFAGDSADDEQEMEDALAAWVESMPGGLAELIDVDGHPGIESCDPEEDVDLALTGRSETSLHLANLWGHLMADGLTALDSAGAGCYASRVLDELTYEEITDPEGTVFAEDGFQDLLEAAFESCSRTRG